MPTPSTATIVKSAKELTNRDLAVAMVTGLSSGGLQCGAIYHFNKNYVCFKGWVWAHNHIDMQFISLHWMILKDERLKWILSTDKVSFIFSCEVYGWVYYVISDVIIFQKTKGKRDRRLYGIEMLFNLKLSLCFIPFQFFCWWMRDEMEIFLLLKSYLMIYKWVLDI